MREGGPVRARGSPEIYREGGLQLREGFATLKSTRERGRGAGEKRKLSRPRATRPIDNSERLQKSDSLHRATNVRTERRRALKYALRSILETGNAQVRGESVNG